MNSAVGTLARSHVIVIGGAAAELVPAAALAATALDVRNRSSVGAARTRSDAQSQIVAYAVQCTIQERWPLMKRLNRVLAVSFAALALVAGSAPAVAGGRHGGHGGAHHSWRGHGYWGPGLFLGGVAIGIGLGSTYYAPWYPGYVVVQQPPVAPYDAPPLPAEPVAPPAPDPIFYPRNGQSADQTEADRRACNRWATTQPSAMADASVFHRATLACMEGRGYAVR